MLAVFAAITGAISLIRKPRPDANFGLTTRPLSLL